MINIIKQGTLYPYRINCVRCGCIFEFQDEDIQTMQAHQNEYVEKIACPCCKKEIHTWSREQWYKKVWKE